MSEAGQQKIIKEAQQVSKKKGNGKKVDEVELKSTKSEPTKSEKPKAEQATRREAFWAKHEKQIREHFSKEGAKASELKKVMGFKDERSYLDLLWARDKIIAEKK